MQNEQILRREHVNFVHLLKISTHDAEQFYRSQWCSFLLCMNTTVAFDNRSVKVIWTTLRANSSFHTTFNYENIHWGRLTDLFCIMNISSSGGKLFSLILKLKLFELDTRMLN